MPNRAPLPAELLRAPFRTRELDEYGVPRKRLRSADIVHPHHGLNSVVVSPTNLRERAAELAILVRPGEVFSHLTAAALLGVPLPASRDHRLHVTVVGGSDRMRRPGVAGHRAESLAVTMLGTLPIVEPAHVFAQLAPLLAHDDLVAAGDYLVTPQRVARKPALTSIDALRAAIPARARGAARARRALDDIRVGSESPMETKTRLILLRAGLPEPELNPEIAAYHPDLFYPQWRLAIEYLGDQHRTDPREWGRDIRRREVFEDAGYRVLLVTRVDVLAEPERLLARVARAIAQQQRH